MSSSSEVLTFSRGEVDSLSDYHKCLAERLSETGRIVIKDTSEKPEDTE